MKKPVWLQAMWDGMLLRCPVCRQGRIYRSWSRIHEECPNCGVAFEARDGEFLGAVTLTYAVTAVLVTAGIYVLGVLTDLSAEAHFFIWSAFAIVFITLFYRNFKGIWLGIVSVSTGLRKRG